MEELVERAQKDDEQAFNELILKIQKEMYLIAKSKLKDEEDIADAIQETILSCYKNLKKLRDKKLFKTWLIRILINECNKIHRQNKKIIYLENYNQTDLVYNDKYDDFGVRQAIKKLDEDLKTMVILYYFEEFSVKEISEIQKLPEGTVKSRLSRARKKLESIFLDENIEKEDLNG